MGRQLTDLGIHIEDEDLLEEELFAPFDPFDPHDERVPERNAFISLTGDASVVEVSVHPNAPIAGSTLENAVEAGVLDAETLVIGIERGDRELTPHGDTVVRAADIVTVLSRGADGEAFVAFGAPDADSDAP